MLGNDIDQIQAEKNELFNEYTNNDLSTGDYNKNVANLDDYSNRSYYRNLGFEDSNDPR